MKTQYTCPQCGSHNLESRGNYLWSYRLQKWIPEGLDEDTICFCQDCSNYVTPDITHTKEKRVPKEPV